MNMRIDVSLLFAIYFYINVAAQESDITEVEKRSAIPCQTKDNKNGYCLPVSRCRRIIDSIRRFETPNICFFEDDQPHICCPVRLRNRPSSTRRPPNRPIRTTRTTTTTTTTTTRRPRTTTKRTNRPFSAGPVSSLTKVELNPPGCGKRIYVPSQGSAFVVGGKEAEKHSWPWMAAIRVRTFGDNTGFLCGGSLITARHVLTAAHCFEGQLNVMRTIDDYKIILGSHYRIDGNPSNPPEEEKGTITVKPIAIKLHEGYQSNTNDNDVAVITLDATIPITDHIKQVCLPGRSNSDDPGYVTVIGWGDTSYGGIGSKSLQEASFETVQISRCRRIFRRIPSFAITENMLCAGDLDGERDACQNDSGGPLLASNADENSWTQVGIVSFGYNCAERGFPGVYTKVANFVPWIRRQIRN